MAYSAESHRLKNNAPTATNLRSDLHPGRRLTAFFRIKFDAHNEMAWLFLGQSQGKSGDVMGARISFAKLLSMSISTQVAERAREQLAKLPEPDLFAMQLDSGITLGDWMKLANKRIAEGKRDAVAGEIEPYLNQFGPVPQLLALRDKLQKDKFFSIIAHDLRSPFNGFLGLTQIMAKELSSLTSTEIQKIAVNLHNSATHLFRLLENLLHWARMNQGLIPFNPEVRALLPIVRESVEMIHESAKSKRIRIQYDFTDDIVVFADTNMLQTIIRNLVSNAIKFTPRGGQITLCGKENSNKNIEIAIKDNGIGMSPLLVEQLFRIDVQTGRRGTEDEPSTGLGLLLCKEFIEKHGGKIWVESIEGKGSTFIFTIPYERNSDRL